MQVNTAGRTPYRSTRDRESEVSLFVHEPFLRWNNLNVRWRSGAFEGTKLDRKDEFILDRKDEFILLSPQRAQKSRSSAKIGL